MAVPLNVLFLCTGNICRSPLAAAAARRAIARETILIHSAGTHALDGRPASRRMAQAAEEIGLDLSSHRAQQLTPELAASMDLVFCMEPHHLDYAERIGAKGRAVLLGDRPIDDPFGRSSRVYARVRDEITFALDAQLPEILALSDS